MKKLVLASVSALALFGVAACSDSTDQTTTQSVPDTRMNEPAPVPADPATPAVPPAIDNSTTQSITPAPQPQGQDSQAPLDLAPMDSDTVPAVPAQ